MLGMLWSVWTNTFIPFFNVRVATGNSCCCCARAIVAPLHRHSAAHKTAGTKTFHFAFLMNRPYEVYLRETYGFAKKFSEDYPAVAEFPRRYSNLSRPLFRCSPLQPAGRARAACARRRIR